MDPKHVADIPSALISVVIIAGVTGFVEISPVLFFSSWVLLSMSFIFLTIANIVYGGYRNDWHRNEKTGSSWRESLIALVLLLVPFFAGMGFIFWEKANIDMRLLAGVIFAGVVYSCLNVKLRYAIFKYFTPNEKESSMRVRDMMKYMKWYTWLILLIYSLLFLLYIFSKVIK